MSLLTLFFPWWRSSSSGPNTTTLSSKNISITRNDLIVTNGIGNTVLLISKRLRVYKQQLNITNVLFVKILESPKRDFLFMSSAEPYSVYSTIRNYHAIYNNNITNFISSIRDFVFTHDRELRKRHG